MTDPACADRPGLNTTRSEGFGQGGNCRNRLPNGTILPLTRSRVSCEKKVRYGRRRRSARRSHDGARSMISELASPVSGGRLTASLSVIGCPSSRLLPSSSTPSSATILLEAHSSPSRWRAGWFPLARAAPAPQPSRGRRAPPRLREALARPAAAPHATRHHGRSWWRWAGRRWSRQIPTAAQARRDQRQRAPSRSRRRRRGTAFRGLADAPRAPARGTWWGT